MTTPPPLSQQQQQQQQSEPIINTKPNHVVSWQNELSEFFNGIGLTETSQCFNTELIVLSRHYLERLPIELEKLVERLLQSLEQHVQAKEEQESKQQQQLQKSNNNNNDLNDQQEQQQKEEEKQQLSTESNNNTIVSKLLYNNKKRKRPEGEEEEEEKEKEEQERVQSMDSEKVQIRATNNEIQQRIQTFIQAKQTEVDESNRTEFLNRVDPTSSDVTCARADAREINRNIQMKFDIVNNEDGPLARSLISSSTNNNNNNNNNHEKISTTETILNERIQNIEQHLNVSFDNQAIPPFSLHERIKILENVLMDIEREHPKWAAIHFQQPNRKFPPAPPITYIMRPDGSKGEYITTQQVPQPPPTIPGHPHMKTTGRANSSLTRAVLEQLNRKRQQQAIVESSSTSSSSSPIINNIHSIPSSSSSTSPTL